MFESISIQGLRVLKNIVINDFQQFNLFVGSNNCGKTTLLEGIFLLSSPTNAQLPLKINRFRGINSIDDYTWRLLFKDLDIHSNIKISGELEKPKETRKLVIKPNKDDSIKYTSIAKASANKGMIDIKNSYSERTSAIDGLILEYSFKGSSNRNHKKITTEILRKGEDLEFVSPKSYEEIIQAVFINHNTIFGDVAKRFNDIQIKKQTERIVNVLSKIEPALNSLVSGPDGVIYCDIGLERMLPISVMGDGIPRILAIILAIADTQNGIVIIDEIENGFHYSSQEILWNAIISSAKEFNVQVFATTHSLECVKAYSGSYSRLYPLEDNLRLFRIERRKEAFEVISYDNTLLESSLDSNWEVR